MPSDRDNVFTSIGAMLPDDVIAELGLEPYSDDARQHPRDVAQIVTRLCDGLNAARTRAERAEARLAEMGLGWTIPGPRNGGDDGNP